MIRMQGYMWRTVLEFSFLCVTKYSIQKLKPGADKLHLFT